MGNIQTNSHSPLLETKATLKLQLSDNSLDACCAQVEQRNWSRVVEAVLHDSDSAADSKKVFLKQHVGSDGRWHTHLWEYEQQGTMVAREMLQDIIHVPAVIGVDPELLVIVFEHRDIVSTDILLRRSPQAFEQAFPIALARIARVLEAIMHQRYEDPAVMIPEKKRAYGNLGNAITFKGLDFRNVGFLMHATRAPTEDDVIMFDFGRPYYAPIEEAAAKLIVSIGLLNWGDPLARFLKGPDKHLLETAADRLKLYLDANAIDAELRLQAAFRRQEVHASNMLRRTVKELGIATVGRDYLRKLTNWFEKYFSVAAMP